MPPLPLDSPRWRQLKAHFGNAGEDTDLPSVPKLLSRWHRAVGTYAEEYEYADLRESYVHQMTICDVAYAVVPHVASRLAELDSDRRDEVLEELAVVESARLKPPEQVDAMAEAVRRRVEGHVGELMAQSVRDHHPVLPPDLAPAYLEAIAHVDTIAGPRWRETKGSDEAGAQPRAWWRRHIRFLRETGWLDDDIAFGVRALRADDLIYETEDAREVLCGLDDVPDGWLERTRLRSPDGDLGYRALCSLAWWRAYDVDTMLATPGL